MKSSLPEADRKAASATKRDKLGPLKDNCNHIKSSMMYPSNPGMIINHAKFHMTAKK